MLPLLCFTFTCYSFFSIRDWLRIFCYENCGHGTKHVENQMHIFKIFIALVLRLNNSVAATCGELKEKKTSTTTRKKKSRKIMLANALFLYSILFKRSDNTAMSIMLNWYPAMSRVCRLQQNIFFLLFSFLLFLLYLRFSRIYQLPLFHSTTRYCA